MSKTYYDILNCSKTSNAEQLKAEYRELARQHHPDKTALDGGKFAHICEAYSVLSNPTRRRVYDLWLECHELMPFNEFERQQPQSSIHFASKPSTARLTASHDPSAIESSTASSLQQASDYAFEAPSAAVAAFRNYRL
eukprot:TRINITY_DN12057_c6_g1_i4.p1 TRINITY_DN12057_c6_g1~~TRINITY_DN12057_c6_g1_i4.p1  ORF type:complete len:138 (+),score=21.05 TRINITY_DN12057_c6_g1_i4:31-444(+)